MPGTVGWCGIVDANILIGAYAKDYTPTAFPGIWWFLDHQINTGRPVLIDAMRKEVLHLDGLVDWVWPHMNLAVRETQDADIVRQHERVIAWIRDSGQFTPGYAKTSPAERTGNLSPSAKQRRVLGPITG